MEEITEKMEEYAYRGDEIAYIVAEAEGHNKWDSIRAFIGGEEINLKDLTLVIYNKKKKG